jgi:hypothetical protein
MGTDEIPEDDPAWEVLAYAAEPIEPPAELRRKLLDRAAGAGHGFPEGFFRVREGVFGVHSGLARWTPTPIPGLDHKILSEDAGRGYTTRLLRFAPGTKYPSHRHAGTEEIFVLEGSLSINGLTLSAGDYCRSEPGTEENETFSETGGIAMVISCDLDEIAQHPRFD